MDEMTEGERLQLSRKMADAVKQLLPPGAGFILHVCVNGGETHTLSNVHAKGMAFVRLLHDLADEHENHIAENQ